MFKLTHHAIVKAYELKAMPHELIYICENNAPIPNKIYPGQLRYIGETPVTRIRLCVNVGKDGSIITAFLDRVVTPLRPDQIDAGVEIKRSR